MRPSDLQGRGWATFCIRHPVLAVGGPALVLVAIGLLGFALMLDSVVDQDDFWRLDEPVLAWLHSLRGPRRTAVLATITLLSGPIVLPVVVALASVGWGLRSRRWWRPVLLPAAVSFAALVTLVIKREVARPRPPVDVQHIPGAEVTFSFPSGHTSGTATLCLVGGYLLWSRRPTWPGLALWAFGTAVATGAVGLSRLYLGYHFVTDVVAAAALAVAVLGVVVAVDQLRLVRRLRRQPARPAPT